MSKYPGQLDTNAELVPVADSATEITSESINALREAVFAIQHALGTNPQGTTANLKARLEQILNPDGTFKSAALVAAGLIALPITNAMIGTSAAIHESKLDLDVPTQTLQTQIASNNIDIASLLVAYNALLVSLASHANGQTQRHDGYDIDVLGGLTSAPAITTVGAALDFIYNSLVSHRGLLAANEHPASAISYTPDPDGPFTATNVQDAVTQIDTAFQEDRRKHNNFAHTNGIVADGYGTHAGQASIASAGKVSRYQPSSGQDQIKLSHINAAAVKTKNLNPLALSATAQSLEFVAKCGSSSRTLQVTGLHTAQYPATNGRFPVRALVEHLNAAFANITNHFPLQAYESGDGEIIIQHNIARSDCAVTVQAPLTNSALAAFGFADINGIEATMNSGSMVYIDGYQHDQLREIFSGQLVLAATSSIINLNTVVGVGGLGLKSGYLMQVYNHTTASANGTYMISAVGSPPSTQINLVTTLTAGTYNCIIYEDVPYLGTSANPRCIDILWGSDLTIRPVTRYQVTLAPISGVSIIEVSPGMASGSGLLQLVTGATNTLQLTVNAQLGPQASFPSGYIGHVQVYAADGISYITCLISSISLTSLTSSVILSSDGIDDTSMKIATSYFDGALIVEIPLEKTPIGSIGYQSLSSDLKVENLELPRFLMIGNGVITGLLTSGLSSTQIAITGGSATVAGRLVEHHALNISVFNKVSATGTWNVVIGYDGKIDIFNDTDAGYSFGTLSGSKEYVTLAQFTTSAGAIATVRDARYIIYNSAHKHVPVVGSSEAKGTFTSLDAANLHASYDASVTDKKIVIATDFTTTSFTIADNLSLECLGDIQFTTLTIGSGSELRVSGQLIATTITIQAGASMVVMGGMNVSGAITIGAGCSVHLLGSSTVGSIVMSGSNSAITGLSPSVQMTFSGATDPCISISNSSNTIENIKLDVGAAYQVSLIQTSLSASNIAIKHCALERLTPLGSWVTGQIGIEVVNNATSSDITIDHCTFLNFDVAVDIAPTTQVGRIYVENCLMQSCNYGIRAGQSDGLVIASNIFQGMYGTYIDCNRNGSGTSHTNIAITGNIFKAQYSGGSGVAIMAGSRSNAFTVSGNIFAAIDTSTSIVNLTETVSGDATAYSISNNVFENCSSPYNGVNFAVTFSTTVYLAINSLLLFEGNFFKEHDGGLLSINGKALVDGNIFDSQSTSGSPYVTITAGPTQSTMLNNNNITTSTDQYIVVAGATLAGNYIDTGSISFTSTYAKDMVCNNTCYLRSTSATSSITLSYASSSQNTAVFSNNIFYVYANTNGMIISGDGALLVSGNTFNPQSGCTNIIYAQAHTTSSTPTYICENIINSGYASIGNSIMIEKHSAFVIGNILRGSGSSPSSAAINLNGASLTNICINGNVLDNTSAAARLINYNSTQDVLITENKNASSTIQQSALGGIQYDTSSGDTAITQWNISASSKYRISITTTAGIAIPLTGLPIGAKLVSCAVYTNAPTTIGSIACRLFARTAASTSATAISAMIFNTGTGAETITVPPTSNTFVTANTEYSITITSTAINNIIGNIVVNIYY